MKLYFLRHGPAASRAEWRDADADRPLTDKGRKVTERVARRLAEIGVRVDAIVTSPYARALQTARIAAEALGAADALEEDPRLEPGFDMPELAQILDGHRDTAGLMLVGHEPDFSQVAGQLIGGADLSLKKAGVVLVELDDAPATHGRLRWLLTPDVLTDGR